MSNHWRGARCGAKAAGQLPRCGSGPQVSRILLIGADPRWSRAIRAAACGSANAGIDTVPSGRTALARLLDPLSPYGHVLLNPARDDGLLSALQALTCDEGGSHAALHVLGRPIGARPHVCVIAGPTRQALRTVLRSGCEADAASPPSVADIRSALADARIETRYQPVVRLTDGEPSGVEVLARLYIARRGLIAPEQFVPRIEAAGLAGELTNLVVNRSFTEMAAPPLARHRLTMAINFPLDVLLLPDTLRRLDARREAAGIAAAQVMIELTESRVVSDLPQLRGVVGRLRHAGYGVAIDDVGPAMANHEALLDMPFTTAKLDKGIVACAAAEGFLRRIVDIAKARGLSVVAEGVADVRTWNRVRRAGADLAQGFAIGRPMPPSVLPDWMTVWRDAGRFR